MKNIKLYLSILIISSLSIFTACNGDSVADKKEILSDSTKKVNESEVLLNFINQSGDIVNTKMAPAIIKANDIYSNLDEYLIIDIRKKDDYVGGHINGAINVEPKKVLSYLETKVNAGTFKKIVIAGYSGQQAEFYTSLLRQLGYGNVYTLAWGMISWNSKIVPNKWGEKISNKYAGVLETKSNPKGKKNNYPVLNTGKITGYGILKARAEKLADEGFKKMTITVDKVMEDKDKYYIINYWPVKHYNIGHLPGAIQYQPRKSFAKAEFLSTLPTDKPIVIYCYKGHHSAFIVPFLRILGYDAYSLVFGANSFMSGTMQNSEIGRTFNINKVAKDFPLVVGKNPSDKQTVVSKQTETTAPQVLIKKKKKKKGEEGGC